MSTLSHLYKSQRGTKAMAKVIMIQGTMSNVGKSLIVAGLCRLIKRDGYCAAPFKSQNMALNSFITEEGLEMGRAQVMQAEAAGIRPLACMNPILLKPTTHTGSQVIVNGQVLGNMSAKEYFAYKKKIFPEVQKAFLQLEKIADIIVIEGAGSPAEINLRKNDIVNMGLAEQVDAPVLLVGDIDRGGVFAQLLGTLMLLTKTERERVKGLIVNKFRGDRSLFDSGVKLLEKKCKRPVIGVVPYMELSLEDEDSLTQRFEKKSPEKLDIAVIHYPRISNFTDFNVFEQSADVSVRYVTCACELGNPDLVFLPGSKNTIDDLRWMRENGLEAAMISCVGEVPIFGICGGYQMLGERIVDPKGVETGGDIKGMGLLPIVTKLQSEKVRRQVKGTLPKVEGIFSALSDMEYSGYEIHMGTTEWVDTKAQNMTLVSQKGKNVYGTYIHGLFDKGSIASALIQALADKKGVGIKGRQLEDYAVFKEKQYDKLADTLSECLNMEEIYGMLGEAHWK